MMQAQLAKLAAELHDRPMQLALAQPNREESTGIGEELAALATELQEGPKVLDVQHNHSADEVCMFRQEFAEALAEMHSRLHALEVPRTNEANATLHDMREDIARLAAE